MGQKNRAEVQRRREKNMGSIAIESAKVWTDLLYVSGVALVGKLIQVP